MTPHTSNTAQEATTIEPARPGDAAAVKALVDGAYSKYIDRMGRLPAPMSADYAELAASGDLYVLRAHGVIAGAVLLTQDHDSIKINNLVVGEAEQGKGYGRELMLFAERMARSKNLPALTLFTNALMHENIALYTKTGFVITGRKNEAGFDRIYFRKQLD